ncbi:hypothetical protein [Mucilaginibacter sp. UR6-11]|uniref:hypothetical protein n=1 Tax=Mucilaginibacter sp. UR6-11 TaxID=1435644 RepID=UPI001E414441|nr:hypothetical protein [Mucilaginibacter sp. UR6-11]MCC8426361.1 hypothetical protein [Mucilaginibacter sp. UR6-11]
MKKVETAQKVIGGYLGLELPVGNEYYPHLVRLNTGRNALEYILREKHYRKIYIPYFTCVVLLEPIIKLGLEYQFYSINEQLEPIIDFEIEPDACFLYTDYFGIKYQAVKNLSDKITNLIIDNSQAFFSEPLKGVDTFYSCRKFFGVSDGAYLQIKRKSSKRYPVDSSVHRFSHLLKNIDQGIQQGYSDYLKNNKDLENNPIRIMSPLTKRILSGINYAECARIRMRNFNFIHKHLKHYNLFKFNFPETFSPLVYPFLSNDRQLKLHLIQRNIFVPTYWPNVFEWTDTSMYENYLARNIVPLPIDHRYSLFDMNYMLNTLRTFI